MRRLLLSNTCNIQGNPGLCGVIPGCLLSRVPDLDGTSLIDPTSSSRNPDGGLCEAAAPACDPAKGCG